MYVCICLFRESFMKFIINVMLTLLLLLLWSSLREYLTGWYQASILSQCSYHQLIRLIPNRQCGDLS